jgi:hypothetical protein
MAHNNNNDPARSTVGFCSRAPNAMRMHTVAAHVDLSCVQVEAMEGDKRTLYANVERMSAAKAAEHRATVGARHALRAANDQLRDEVRATAARCAQASANMLARARGVVLDASPQRVADTERALRELTVALGSTELWRSYYRIRVPVAWHGLCGCQYCAFARFVQLQTLANHNARVLKRIGELDEEFGRVRQLQDQEQAAADAFQAQAANLMASDVDAEKMRPSDTFGQALDAEADAPKPQSL